MEADCCTVRFCRNEGGVWFDAVGVAYRICRECAEERKLLSTDPLVGQTCREYLPGDEIAWQGV